MGLAEEIKQTKFKNKHEEAGINILYTNNWIEDKLRCTFSCEDLTPQQFNVLRILRGSHPEPLSTLQIRERMIDKMSDTSRIVDRLRKKELVCKNTCANDKRLVDVCISEKGLETLARMDKKIDDWDRILKNLTATEAETLSLLLDKIREQDLNE